MNTRKTNISVADAIIPQVAITILVDVSYVINNQQDPSAGIYMFDNMSNMGSTDEGGYELNTVCSVNNVIGWNILPINYLNPNGDSVSIYSITCEGNIFGNQLPTPVTSPGSEPADAYWVAQAVNSAPTLIYQPTLCIAVGAINPQYVYVTWDPYITVN